MSVPAAPAPLVSLADIAEIELFILKRMKELTLGDHASVFKGSGFDFVGLRDWEPGDRLSAIDWAQSSLTGFSPLVIRDFEQPSTAIILAVADASLSTRCGAHGTLIAALIGRSLAAVGLSAVLFQDQFGLIAFDGRFGVAASARPRIGKQHVLYCIDLYQSATAAATDAPERSLTTAIEGALRRPALVPVVSDFLFAEAPEVIDELGRLHAVHDILLLMVDARFAYRLQAGSAGWFRIADIESGGTRLVSRREFARLADAIGAWQEQLLARARAAGLDLVRVGLDRWDMETTLVEFAAERRLRKT